MKQKAQVYSKVRLDLLQAYLEHLNGQDTYPRMPPTIRQLQAMTGISSTSIVSYHLVQLVKHGIMKYAKTKDDHRRGKYLIIANKLDEILAELATRDLHSPQSMLPDTRR